MSSHFVEPLTPLQERALARTRELETEILETYGLRIRSGIEIEFYYRDVNGQPPKNKLELQPYNPQDGFYKTSGNSFIGSPYIEKLYTEKGTQKYELVIGEGRGNRYKPKDYTKKLRKDPWKQSIKGLAPSVIARAAHTTRGFLERNTDQLPEGKARFWAIDPDPSRNKATAGLHCNVSLWDEEGSYNILAQEGGGPDGLAGVLLHAGLEAQKALFPLIVESEHSLIRFGRGEYVPKTIEAKIGNGNKEFSSLTFRDGMGGQDQRLEHRLPGADADPFLATLMAVGGIYWGLKHGVCVDAPPSGSNSEHFSETKLIFPSFDGETKPRELPLWIRNDMRPTQKYEIPKLKAYGAMLEHWEEDEIANEILGKDLLEELAELRKDQYAAMRSKRERAEPVGQGI